ncbi:15112_t:CDS:1, partial [Dentiscutata heterogama]
MSEKHSNNSNSEFSNKKRKPLNKDEKKRTKSSWIWHYFDKATDKDKDGKEFFVIICKILNDN